MPSLATVPLVIVANVAWGDGAATRAGTVVVSAWLAFVSVWLPRTPGGEADMAPAT